MQLSEVQQRFSRVEQCIDDAYQACQQSQSATPELQDSIRQLDQRADEAASTSRARISRRSNSAFGSLKN